VRQTIKSLKDYNIRVPNSIFRHLIHQLAPDEEGRVKDNHSIKEILEKIKERFLKHALRSSEEISPHVRVMRSNAEISPQPHARVMRSDEAISPHVRVMRAMKMQVHM
jgi:hypothetical protein